MRNRLRNCVQNERANVTILFALMSLPMMAMVSLSIDNQRQTNLKHRIQHAVDMAALAGARSIFDPSFDDVRLSRFVFENYRENLATAPTDADCSAPIIQVDRTNDTVMVEGECLLPTTFGVGISGHRFLTTSARSNAKGGMSQADIALAIDVSDSMNMGGRLDDVKTAVENMTDLLINPLTGGSTRISFAAFSSSVNAGVYGNLAQGKARDDDSDGDGLNRVCVTERTGSMAYTNAPPGPGQWVGDDASAICQDETGVVPLSSDAAAFKQAVNALEAKNFTAGHIAIAWAWYLISPEWAPIWTLPPSSTSGMPQPDTSAVPLPNDGQSHKAIIILSDGDFSQSYSGVPSFNQALRLCVAAKKDGVRIYSIAFKVSVPTAKYVLERCATSTDHYFDVSSGAQLNAVYQEIGSHFLGPRLIQ